MKKLIPITFILFICWTNKIYSQNIGINDNGAAPNTNAVLDIDISTNDKGVLLPRLTTAERTGIAGLGVTDEGLIVYDETTTSFWFWDGTQWVEISNSGDDWEIIGNSGTNPSINFLGTTDNQSLIFRTNNLQRMMIHSGGNISVGSAGTPGAKIHTFDESNIDDIILNDFNNSAGASPRLRFRKARGSQAAPLGVLSNWTLGALDFDGFSGSSNVVGARISVQTQASFSAADFSSDIIFSTNNSSNALTERMRIRFNGNVGIGTVTPSQLLHVNGIARVEKILIVGGDPSDPVEGGQLSLDKATNGLSNGVLDMYTFGNPINASGLRLFVGGVMTSGLYIADGLHQTIGNVGIGTVNPDKKLHVNGEIGIANSQGIFFRNAANTAWIRGLLGFADDDIYIGAGAGGNSTATSIHLDVGGLAGTSAVFVEGTTGNVGIRTTAPTANLSVNGTANKTGGGTWAVFSDKRLKRNITDYKEGMDLLNRVHVVNFQYNQKYSTLFGGNKTILNQTYQGVIAQELQLIAPDMVKEVSVKDETILEVDPNKFTYALINAAKEQQKELNELKKEVAELKIIILKLTQ